MYAKRLSNYSTHLINLNRKDIFMTLCALTTLRHTYATDLQSAGVPLNVAKDLLGHQSIAMTSQIYTHLSVDAFAEASLKVINFQHAQHRKAKKKSVGNR